MCKPYSCLISSDLRLIEGQTLATHSHTQIMKQHGIRDEISVNQYARVELVPVKDGDYDSDPTTWNLILDEERTPDWWTGNLPEITGRVHEAAERWKRKLLLKESFAIGHDELLVCFGNMRPVISVTGGVVSTWDNSQPTIQSVTGGEVRTRGNSQPTIQSVTGGEVRTWGNSQPTIQSVTGGVVSTWGNSQPTIQSVTGGVVSTWDNSQPTIQSVTGGVVRTWDNSQPTIQSVTGGVVSTCENSQPTIQSVTGGDVRTLGNKTPIILEDKR